MKNKIIVKVREAIDLDATIEKANRNGKREILNELISIWKDRNPLEQFTTNVILLELKVRLNNL